MDWAISIGKAEKAERAKFFNKKLSGLVHGIISISKQTISWERLETKAVKTP